MGADNLKWEKAKKIDVGIEGELFNSKLSFVVDFFKDIRDGIFQQRQQVPGYIGLVSMPFGNVCSMKSYGSDGNVTYIQNIGKDMSVTFRGNFTLSNNRVNYFEEADTKYEYNLTNYKNKNSKNRKIRSFGNIRRDEKPYKSFWK